jgi:pimeloyl-ACP methyl ester carboxylesterase
MAATLDSILEQSNSDDIVEIINRLDSVRVSAAQGLLIGLIVCLLMPLVGCQTFEPNFAFAEREVPVEPGLHLITLQLGEGEPVVFVDDTPGDSASWGIHLGEFSGAGYQAIQYNRRFEPSDDDSLLPARSAKQQGEELIRLLDALDLKKVHLVARSYGAYTALLFALEHRDRVRTLTLCEPPIFPFLEEIDGDVAVLAQSLQAKVSREMLGPVRQAYDSGDDQLALERFLDFSIVGGGAFEKLSPVILQGYRMNAGELKSLILSDRPYPPVDRDRVRALKVPTLIISGAMTTDVNTFICQQLDTLLPAETHKRVVIDCAGHWTWYDNPEACRVAVLDFIESWADGGDASSNAK